MSTDARLIGHVAHKRTNMKLREVTLQQWFDNAVNGMRKQNYEPSYAQVAVSSTPEWGVTQAQYNGPNGTHCALGWTLYQLEDVEIEENVTVEVLLEKKRLAPDVPIRALARLQLIHDDIVDGVGCLSRQLWPARFEMQFKNFAQTYNLEYVPPQSTKEQA